MDNKQLLAEALDYAIEHHTFNKAVKVQRAKNVCCFGLGTYFKESFVSKNLQQKWHVNLLSDNDDSKWGKTFCGLPCVPPEELKKYDDLAVIILLGDPRPVQKQLRDKGIWHVTHVDLSIDDELGFTKDIEEFVQTRDKYLEAYSIFEDDESKQIYVNALINRIAPEKSVKSWDEMCTGNEYFGQPFMRNVSEGGDIHRLRRLDGRHRETVFRICRRQLSKDTCV